MIILKPGTALERMANRLGDRGVSQTTNFLVQRHLRVEALHGGWRRSQAELTTLACVVQTGALPDNSIEGIGQQTARAAKLDRGAPASVVGRAYPSTLSGV